MKPKYYLLFAFLASFVLLLQTVSSAQEEEKERHFALKLGYVTLTCDGCGGSAKGFSVAGSYLTTPNKKGTFEVGISVTPLSASDQGVTLDATFTDLSVSYLFGLGDSLNSPYAGPIFVYSKVNVTASGFGQSLRGSNNGTGFGAVLGTKFGGRALGEIRYTSVKYEGTFRNLAFYVGYLF